MNARLWLVFLLCALWIGLAGESHARSASSVNESRYVGKATGEKVPPSWEILPIPRYVDYGSSKSFVAIKNVAIVRQEGGPYQIIRDQAGELVGNSTITEEELTGILKETGVNVSSVGDRLGSYDGFDTLILLGSPKHNYLTDEYFRKMKLSFSRWDDPNTSGHDFNAWKDFGREGYLLKVGRCAEKNIIVLAGYDRDDTKNSFCGAGTFYALQSLRQLIVKDKNRVKIKTAEIADAPLIGIRACMTGSPVSEEKQWRDIAYIAQIKANQNNWWYGNGIVGYNAEATAKFRYPWKSEQLDLIARVGKWCREHFITMVFCMNPDHYGVEWAAPKTFDGSKKDPMHYDPNYQVEPQFKEMWSKLGYTVESDIDIIAAKYGQLNKAVPGCMLMMMNEDDGFGLIHESDKKLYNTQTGDPKQDAINYGRARAMVLALIYKRIRSTYPDSPEYMPFDAPGALVYQFVLDRDEAFSREFLWSLGTTFKEMGVMENLPMLTTGGGTHAEVITNEEIDNLRKWSNGCPVVLHENNFGEFHTGAYETDPKGSRSLGQINETYPAGFRDKELYKQLWGTIWNGAPDVRVLFWCQSQYMWNMLSMNRERINALATRKVCSAELYPLVKSIYDEFDNPMAYLPDNQPPYRVLTISDAVAFPSDGWKYSINYSGDKRVECQRLCDKLRSVMSELDAKWENKAEKEASFKEFGFKRLNFCDIYLAYGYIMGWHGESIKMEKRLKGAQLRDLYLEAEDLQQRYFAGPESVPGRATISDNYYTGLLHYIYMDGNAWVIPKTPAEAKVYVDIWKDGLLGKFFEPVSSVIPSGLADDDARLTGAWRKVEESDKEKFRAVTGEVGVSLSALGKGRVLIRMRLGTDATAHTESTKVTLSLGRATQDDAVCKPRWINWLLPDGVNASKLTIKSEKPVRVYAIEIYKEKFNY